MDGAATGKGSTPRHAEFYVNENSTLEGRNLFGRTALFTRLLQVCHGGDAILTIPADFITMEVKTLVDVTFGLLQP